MWHTPFSATDESERKRYYRVWAGESADALLIFIRSSFYSRSEFAFSSFTLFPSCWLGDAELELAVWGSAWRVQLWERAQVSACPATDTHLSRVSMCGSCPWSIPGPGEAHTLYMFLFVSALTHLNPNEQPIRRVAWHSVTLSCTGRGLGTSAL